MDKVRDDLLTVAVGPTGLAVCHLRLYVDEASEQTVAILGELTDNPGMSVTNEPEAFAVEVFKASPTRDAVLIEHYPADKDSPDGTWDLVTLEGPGPKWRRVSRAYVEALVGEPLRVWTAPDYRIREFTALASRDPDPDPDSVVE